MDNNNKTAITSTFVSSITTIKCLVLVVYLFSSLFFYATQAIITSRLVDGMSMILIIKSNFVVVFTTSTCFVVNCLPQFVCCVSVYTAILLIANKGLGILTEISKSFNIQFEQHTILNVVQDIEYNNTMVLMGKSRRQRSTLRWISLQYLPINEDMVFFLQPSFVCVGPVYILQ